MKMMLDEDENEEASAGEIEGSSHVSAAPSRHDSNSNTSSESSKFVNSNNAKVPV